MRPEDHEAVERLLAQAPPLSTQQAEDIRIAIGASVRSSYERLLATRSPAA
jgi:hypothetical protein